MIVFVAFIITVNFGPILFFMGKQIKLIIVKYFRNIARWFIKTLLADSF
jgi:hypothetical protein